MAGQRKSICLVQPQSTGINSHPFIGTAWSQHDQTGGRATAPSPHPMALPLPQNCALFFATAGFLIYYTSILSADGIDHLIVLCTSEHLTATNPKAALWPLNLAKWIDKF